MGQRCHYPPVAIYELSSLQWVEPLKKGHFTEKMRNSSISKYIFRKQVIKPLVFAMFSPKKYTFLRQFHHPPNKTNSLKKSRGGSKACCICALIFTARQPAANK